MYLLWKVVILHCHVRFLWGVYTSAVWINFITDHGSPIRLLRLCLLSTLDLAGRLRLGRRQRRWDTIGFVSLRFSFTCIRLVCTPKKVFAIKRGCVHHCFFDGNHFCLWFETFVWHWCWMNWCPKIGLLKGNTFSMAHPFQYLLFMIHFQRCNKFDKLNPPHALGCFRSRGCLSLPSDFSRTGRRSHRQRLLSGQDETAKIYGIRYSYKLQVVSSFDNDHI